MGNRTELSFLTVPRLLGVQGERETRAEVRASLASVDMCGTENMNSELLSIVQHMFSSWISEISIYDRVHRAIRDLQFNRTEEQSPNEFWQHGLFIVRRARAVIVQIHPLAENSDAIAMHDDARQSPRE